MSLIVIVIGVVLLSVPALVTRGSLSPAVRVRTACAAAALGMWIVGIGIVLAASPLSLRWHHGPDPSSVGLMHLSPGGPLAWAACGVVGVIGASWLLSTLRRSIQARRRAYLPRWAAESVRHDAAAGAEVRVAPTLEPVAFAVPGRDRHVVISQAVSRLPESQRRAVVAHEGAHLRLRHDRHLLVLAMYERIWGWLPGVRAVVASHRRCIEQWADLEAAQMSQVDRVAIVRARTSLQTNTTAPTAARTLDVFVHSSLQHLIGVVVFVAGLVVAGIYSASHSIGDLSAAISAAH